MSSDVEGTQGNESEREEKRMSTDNETRLRTVLRRLSNQRTESGVKAALALALWTQTQLPTINQTQCPRRPKC